MVIIFYYFEALLAIVGLLFILHIFHLIIKSVGINKYFYALVSIIPIIHLVSFIYGEIRWIINYQNIMLGIDEAIWINSEIFSILSSVLLSYFLFLLNGREKK